MKTARHRTLMALAMIVAAMIALIQRDCGPGRQLTAYVVILPFLAWYYLYDHDYRGKLSARARVACGLWSALTIGVFAPATLTWHFHMHCDDPTLVEWTPLRITLSVIYVVAAVWWGYRWGCDLYGSVDDGESRGPGILNSRLITLASAIVSIGCLSALFYFAWKPAITYDELFSLSLVSHDFDRMIEIGATDVHPMAYYIILKGALTVREAVLPLVPEFAMGKMVTIVPVIGVLALIATYVRRDWGRWVAAISAIALFAMPNMLDYELKIRMYSWAMLWVLITFIALSRVMLRGSGRAVIAMTLGAVAAACTHHFAAIAAATLYIIWAIYVIAARPKRQAWWLIASVAVALALYAPQGIVSFNQVVGTVNREYWIISLDFTNVMRLVRYAWGYGAMMTFCGIASAVYVRYWRMKGADDIARPLLLVGAVVMPLVVLAVGLIVSYSTRPIIYNRYLYPTYIVMWIAVAAMIAASKNYRLKVWFTALVAMNASLSFLGFPPNERKNYNKIATPMDVISHHPGATYLFMSPHAVDVPQTVGLSRMVFYPNQSECYYWRWELPQLWEDTFDLPASHRIDTPAQLGAVIDSIESQGGVMMGLINGQAPESMIREFEQAEIKLTFVEQFDPLYQIMLYRLKHVRPESL